MLELWKASNHMIYHYGIEMDRGIGESRFDLLQGNTGFGEKRLCEMK
jgi:hypothetical protein